MGVLEERSCAAFSLNKPLFATDNALSADDVRLRNPLHTTKQQRNSGKNLYTSASHQKQIPHTAAVSNTWIPKDSFAGKILPSCLLPHFRARIGDYRRQTRHEIHLSPHRAGATVVRISSLDNFLTLTPTCRVASPPFTPRLMRLVHTHPHAVLISSRRRRIWCNASQKPPCHVSLILLCDIRNTLHLNLYTSWSEERGIEMGFTILISSTAPFGDNNPHNVQPNNTCHQCAI